MSDGLDSLLLLFDRVRVDYSGNLYSDYVIHVSEFLSACTGRKLETEKLQLFGRFLQQLGLLLDKR